MTIDPLIAGLIAYAVFMVLLIRWLFPKPPARRGAICRYCGHPMIYQKIMSSWRSGANVCDFCKTVEYV